MAVSWILWAYTPKWAMQALSITYYPDRYWAVALPMYGMCLFGYIVVIYNVWNLCNTNPFRSYYTIRDCAAVPAPRKDRDMSEAFEAAHFIPPAEDMPITQDHAKTSGARASAVALRKFVF